MCGYRRSPTSPTRDPACTGNDITGKTAQQGPNHRIDIQDNRCLTVAIFSHKRKTTTTITPNITAIITETGSESESALTDYRSNEHRGLPWSPSGIKCFVHERPGVYSQHPIGRCYVTADNVTVQHTHVHLSHPFIGDVTGSHDFISDRKLENKDQHSRGALKIRMKGY